MIIDWLLTRGDWTNTGLVTDSGLYWTYQLHVWAYSIDHLVASTLMWFFTFKFSVVLYDSWLLDAWVNVPVLYALINHANWRINKSSVVMWPDCSWVVWARECVAAPHSRLDASADKALHILPVLGSITFTSLASCSIYQTIGAD